MSDIIRPEVRALLSGVEESYSRAKIKLPETAYRDVQRALMFTIGLISSYSGCKQYHEDGLKDWPANPADAFSKASKFKLRSGQLGDGGRVNAFTMRGRGHGRGHGRYPGRGRGSQFGGASGTEYMGGASEGPSEYSTLKGSCHTSCEEGHYSFECKGKNNDSNVMKLGATSAQSEPSAYGKGN